jgi:hypothetical protein
MHRRIAGVLASFAVSALLLCCPRTGLGAEFDSIVRSVQEQSGCERTHIPFFWLARVAVAVGRPAGASQLKLALFERPAVAPERFSEIVDDAVGPVWRPMVRVRSQQGEVTSIFVRENGGHAVRILIANKDRDDAELVEIRLDVGRLLRFVDEHQHTGTLDAH